MTSARSLFDGFEAQRTPVEGDYRAVLRNGLVVIDTNVLLDLYRMSAPVREDMLTVLKTIASRLWIPHQVQLEFWNVRQSNDLIEHHDKKASSARDTLRATVIKSRNAVDDWVNTHATARKRPQAARRRLVRVGACPPVSAGQADQEARRAAEMVFTILGERVDHEEAMGGVWLGLAVWGTVRRGEAGGAGE
ncbi:PIN-like domain-containing protein [Streptomyces sp. KS_5]|uniref:PIN-like domain-containing protein n=1 Tax=Streptomyces TaxID=1883 RepID=UPI0008944081|nr:PIN-like domain-containing protein [Streptomyces sp. KS_5]SED52556.1 hypothetical protein SAMN05428938_5160 [Streptomyces sp. KS_5]